MLISCVSTSSQCRGFNYITHFSEQLLYLFTTRKNRGLMVWPRTDWSITLDQISEHISSQNVTLGVQDTSLDSKLDQSNFHPGMQFIWQSCWCLALGAIHGGIADPLQSGSGHVPSFSAPQPRRIKPAAVTAVA